MLPLFLCGQQTYTGGLLPTINLNARLKKGWGLNFKIENRHILTEGLFDESEVPRFYEFERQDFVLLGSKNLAAGTKIAGGYMLRFTDGRDVHRLIQQLSITRRGYKLKFAHRLSSDQTWLADNSFELRLRYRFGFELPIQGTTLDPGEFYFKTHLEYLARFREGFRNELRALPALGLLTLNKNSFEIGIDYRSASSEERNFVIHGFWLYLGWYVRFDLSDE
jgi:hypothetical protein